MFVYALAQPIDFFDGLIPLPRWIAEDPDSNTALGTARRTRPRRRASRGRLDRHHAPPALHRSPPTPGTAELFMVIKQDARGTCFVISDTPIDWLLQHCSRHAHPRNRDIGASEHTTQSCLRDTDTQAGAGTASGTSYEPLF